MRSGGFAVGALVALALMVGSTPAFGVSGGKKTGQTCYKGNYIHYQDPSTGRPFASEAACTSSLASTGSLTPYYAVDLSITMVDSSAAECSDSLCASERVRITNPGPVAVTVTYSFSAAWTGTGTADSAGDCSQLTRSQSGLLLSGNCTTTVPAGGNTDAYPVFTVLSGTRVQGIVNVTSVSPTNVVDPNNANNIVTFNFVAP
jgi:hypothetical protein